MKLLRVGLFGSQTRTQVLLAISILGETHASELARLLSLSLSQTQLAVDSLERAGVVVGIVEGKARRLRLNPRYPFLEELTALLHRMTLADPEFEQRLAVDRRRPRRDGKEI